jgi:hypothetical protein
VVVRWCNSVVRKLVLAAIAALALVSVAAAKGPIQVCGSHRCVALGAEGSPPVPLGLTNEMRLLPPAAPAPYFVTRMPHLGAVGYWIPSARVYRLRTQKARAAWIALDPAQVAMLRRATRGIDARGAPTRLQLVHVDGRKVAQPRGYLRLYTIGTPVAAAARPGGWLTIFMSAQTNTPWTDGMNRLAVSRRGAYLRRDGQLVRIPEAVADRIRARLPLTG